MLCFAVGQAKIILMQRAVTQYFGKKLRSGKRFTAQNDAGGIAIEPIAYRRAKDRLISLGDLPFFVQVAEHLFV